MIRYLATAVILVGTVSATPALARSADEIVRELEAVTMPKPPTDRDDREALSKFIAAREAAMRKRTELIGELLKSAPTDERLVRLLPERVGALAQAGKADQAIGELNALLADHPQHPQRLPLRLLLAQLMLHVDRTGPDLDKLINALASENPGDERVAQLLVQSSHAAPTPEAQRALLQRVVRDFGETRSARLAAGTLRQVDGIGQPFDLSFTDAISGQPVDMKQLRGKVVVIDFWATWCGPCLAEMPNMKRLYAEYVDKGVEFIGVSLDVPESQGGLRKLREYVEKNQVGWPQYYQGAGWANEFSSSWGINSIPRVFIVDAEGKLHSTQARGKLEQLIPELIAKRDGKPTR